MDAKGKKRLAIVVSLLAIGGVVGGILYWKSKDKGGKTNETEVDDNLEQYVDTSDDNKSSGGTTTEPTPEPTPEPIIKSSWEKVRDLLIPRGAKDYGDKIEKTSTQESLGLTGLGASGTTAKVIFRKDGRWFVLAKFPGKTDWTPVANGKYYRGGQKVTVGYGKNKGLTVRGKNLMNNIVKAILS